MILSGGRSFWYMEYCKVVERVVAKLGRRAAQKGTERKNGIKNAKNCEGLLDLANASDIY